ncbi:hypothetical protein C8J57DRAFT_1250302 [Mycena rebaudengoi]|nr:hypothetical protein C8J57DRAFT_1250302 [Mycena rebaudengoi]
MSLSIHPASLKTRKRWTSEQLEGYMGKFKVDRTDYIGFLTTCWGLYKLVRVNKDKKLTSRQGFGCWPPEDKGSSKRGIAGNSNDAPPSKRAKKHGTVVNKRPNVAKKRRAAGETDTDSAAMSRPPKRRREAEEKARSSTEDHVYIGVHSIKIVYATVLAMSVFARKPRPPKKPICPRQKSHQSQIQTPIWGQADWSSQSEKSHEKSTLVAKLLPNFISLSPYEVVIVDDGSGAPARKIVVPKSDVINPVSVVSLPTDRNVTAGTWETMTEVLDTRAAVRYRVHGSTAPVARVPVPFRRELFRS